jgi:hypothetical protein
MYQEILDFCIDNGRILSNEDGTYQPASVEAEIEFEARERGFNGEQIDIAVAYALDHTNHD